MLVMAVVLALPCTGRSDDVFREVEKIKSEMSDLKSQVSELRNMVLELRKVVLRSATGPGRQAPAKTAAKEAKAAKPTPPVDEAQLTKIICPAVGRFFQEAEAALRSSDAAAAQSAMRKAFDKLSSSFKGYAATHRASKLLAIYDGLAWDVYTAVEFQGSVSGNEKFLQALSDHKRKYLETCPKE